MQHTVKNQTGCRRVDFIVLNDTRRPTTGGDYVYAVMKDELVKQGYTVSELSIPLLIEPVRSQFSHGFVSHVSSLTAEALAYARCYISSLKKFAGRSRLIITSSCPTFPAFGHLTYHQPKAGICTRFIKEGDNSMRRMIGYRVQENDKLSPLWLLAKRLVTFHLSNSRFTKELVKKIYGLDSKVLYPPVPVLKYLNIDVSEKRKPYIYVARPQAITGIALLPQIARHFPKNAKLVITGHLDHAGNKALRDLKDAGIDFEYLGFVDETVKKEVLKKSSVYLNLAVNETFGITVVEALAAGCIPIAHNSGSIPEFLPSQLLYSNYEECAEKIHEHINSERDIREQLRTLALKFDEAKFRGNFMLFLERLESTLKFKYDCAQMLPDIDTNQVD